MNIWHVISLLLFILAHITNILVIYVCAQKRLRHTPVFLFMIFESIIDIITLYSFSFGNILHEIFKFNIMENYFGCEFIIFIDYFGSQYSSWLLVCIFLLNYYFNFKKYSNYITQRLDWQQRGIWVFAWSIGLKKLNKNILFLRFFYLEHSFFY